MKKIIRKIFLCLRLWIIRRMGYRLPSLREAFPVMPNTLYDHFGYVVMAVPRDKKQTLQPYPTDEVPDECKSCGLFKHGLPCAFNHRMTNGNDICEDHQFVVICINKGNI